MPDCQPTREYLQGAIAALEMIATRNRSDGPGAQKYVAMADIHGLLLIFNQDLKALPPPAPYCQACGNALDGGVAAEPCKGGSDTLITTTDGRARLDADKLFAKLEAKSQAPAEPDWRGLVEELGAALENQQCRCRKRLDETCPSCGGELRAVRNTGPLNDEQFDSVKAGDYFCMKCVGTTAATGYRYWRDRDLETLVISTCSRCAALSRIAASKGGE